MTEAQTIPVERPGVVPRCRYGLTERLRRADV